MSPKALWQRLASEQLVSGEMPASDQQEPALWYVRVLQGFAGWLAAIFMLGFLGFGILGLFEHGLVLMVLGLIVNTCTVVFFRSKAKSDFFEQLVLAFSLTGQFLFAFGLFEYFDFKNQHWLALVAAYQIILVFVIPHYLHRFLSTWFAVIALFWGFELLIYSGLGSALVAALFVWLWMNKTGWESEKEFYEPIGYALGFSLLQLNLQSQFWLFALHRYQQKEASWLMLNADWISACLNSVVLLYLVYRVVKEQQITQTSKTGKLIALAAVMMLFSALPVIGLSSALLVLLVGFARQNKILLVTGVLALLGFVAWYYYSLELTLLNKAIIMMIIGVVLLLGYALLKQMVPSPDEDFIQVDTKPTPVFVLSKTQMVAALVTLLLAVIGVSHGIWKKEQLLKTGQSVWLELAPVDPRSIMQGDYMRLRFAISNEIQNNIGISSLPHEKRNYDGFVYVKTDEQGVGEFYSLQADEDASEPLVKMQYRIRNNQVQFATNAFFFQEGDAKLFDAAKYGEFKVAQNGELLLKAMYDKELSLLGENRLD